MKPEPAFSPNDEAAFRAFERTRHNQVAETYRDFFAPVTSLAIEPLFSAVELVSGCRFLDVACGPGAVTGHAAQRGAIACGVDLSPRMVALAKSLHPEIDFREADVEALPFKDGSFDAVVCNFGIGHFPSAERAMAECARLLRSGGRLAVSWWDLPSRARLLGLFVDALREVDATLPPDLPIGPPMFRYAEDTELRRVLESAGLADIRIQQFSHTHHIESIDAMWEGAMGSFARTSAMVLAQTPEMQQRIRAAYDRLAGMYVEASGVEVPMAFKVAAGTRD